MPSTYELVGHPMLGPDVAALAEGVFDAHVLLAEHTLGVHGSTYTDAAVIEVVKLALAIQVRHQVETDFDAVVVSQKTDGSRSVTYRATLPTVHPMAASLIATLPQSGAASNDDRYANWATVRTLRPVAAEESS